MAQEFEQALRALCIHLAREIARDGEGATRLIEFTVTGAATIDDARQLVRLLSTSYLLKSAIHGADPNWGRIAAVVGRSGVAFDEDRVTIDLCGTRVFERTRPAPFDPEALSLAMRGPEVSVGVHLGAGNAAATGWGCDLSAEYVSINADYHT
jgi:glutamate N-acetyltransferase/amino-acid N-acetyltransferase